METDSSHNIRVASFKDACKTPHKEVPSLIRRFSFNEKLAFWSFFWILIISFLGLSYIAHSKFSVEIPRHGGSMKEGMIGRPAFINPVLALSETDQSLSFLVYSGLLRATQEGDFITDLAEKYTMEENGLSYVVTLKDGLVWHDGEPITADDVVFTINKIKDPLIKSPLRPTWEGVSVLAKNEKTLEFKLEQPYALFLENLTVGIIPKHIWNVTRTEDFINNAYNAEPIGSGPYTIKKIKRNKQGIAEYYTFTSSDTFALGKAYIEKITIQFYSNEEELQSAFEKGYIDSTGGAVPSWAEEQKQQGKTVISFPLARIFGVFLNQNQSKIFTHIEVREALNLATNKERIVKKLLAGYGKELNGPLPPGSLGFIPSESLFSKDTAIERLTSSGWKKNEDGIFEKKIGGQTERLSFSIATANISELKTIAEFLQEDWNAIGVQTEIKIFEIGDLNQEVIRPRNYSALLFGEVTGHNPDPFAFWHSSQRLDPGLNIALYANITTDKLLSDARILLEKDERATKYKTFQEEVIRETPAIFLYSPEYIFITSRKINNINPSPLTVSSERFINIHEWFINTDIVWNFLTT